MLFCVCVFCFGGVHNCFPLAKPNMIYLLQLGPTFPAKLKESTAKPLDKNGVRIPQGTLAFLFSIMQKHGCC